MAKLPVEDVVSSSEESDDDGVTPEAIEKLMNLLGEEALNELEFDEIENVDDSEADEESEESEREEWGEGLLAIDDESSSEEGSEIERPIPAKVNGNSEPVDDNEEEGEEDQEDSEEEEDSEEGVPYEDWDESDEDTVPRQKLHKNNPTALLRVLEIFKIDVPFFETQALTYPEPLNIPDADNDLERELEFYKQSLWAANESRRRFEAAGVPFKRPDDYFAEMVKTDEHMEKVRQKLLDESVNIKASEEAKRQRHLKKFGKKVQIAKQQERDRERKSMDEKVKEFKKKRKSQGGGETEEFDVDLEDEPAAKRSKPDFERKPRMKGKISRQGRDKKFGRPKDSRRPKENTRESTGDLFGGGSNRKGKSFGARGKVAKRPGKSKRHTGKGGR